MLVQPPSGGCVLKHLLSHFRGLKNRPAAFGRLCVETTATAPKRFHGRQPPSGGCVLKPPFRWLYHSRFGQPPSGGCVLKQRARQRLNAGIRNSQPPSGGCVLKHVSRSNDWQMEIQPPSGGCVLKQHNGSPTSLHTSPAAFGRLCVETAVSAHTHGAMPSSRLRAAVC